MSPDWALFDIIPNIIGGCVDAQLFGEKALLTDGTDRSALSLNRLGVPAWDVSLSPA